VFFALAWLALSPAPAQTTNYALGTTNLLVGPAAGTNSVVLAVAPQTATWTATTNARWLHLSPANQSGTGSTNLIFSYDADPGPTRSGTLTVGGQTLTVTQAGSTYVASKPVITLVSSGLDLPYGVAVDGAGNVYIADFYNEAIEKWTASNNTVTTLVSSGLHYPDGVAVDGAGNVYIADYGNNAIKEWTASNSNLTTLVSSGLSGPGDVAVDGAGNVYIADSGNNSIEEWMVANSNVTTLVSSGLNSPFGVAVDGAGNVYIADSGNNSIKEWTAANSNVTTLVSSGLNEPEGVAVDGAGNVYIADSWNDSIKIWTMANSNLTTLVSSGLLAPGNVIVNGAGNVYIADSDGFAIKELPYAFVDPTARLETLAAGNDALPVVLPATANLLAPLNPTSDQSWLTLTGITNGVVNFSFTADSGANRRANITVLGQTIPVTQVGPTSLGTTALLVGPSAGCQSVILAANSQAVTWTATPNAAWLHLSPANQSGTGSTNVVFSYDVNPGATRSGTLTIAAQTLTVTQAGSTYVAPGPVTTLVSLGLSYPFGVAADGAGNVYIADTTNNAIKEWTPANNNVTTLVSSGLNKPSGVAVDGRGNVYIADSGNDAIKKWTAANNNVTMLVSGLNNPSGVAVDGRGNVFIADSGNNAIKEWTAANSSVTTLVSSMLNNPFGVAVDAAGNVYVADSGNNAIKEWTAANSSVTTLISSGVNQPNGVAVDGAGNLYIADSGNNAIKEWAAANSSVTTLTSSGVIQPNGVAVDGAGNLYIADTRNNAIEEWPYAFVDTASKSENAAAGNDALSAVLPATANLLAPFEPTSDQPWLTITGITNGVVSFSFTDLIGPTPSRRANITVLGQTIPITQAGPTYSLGTTALLEGSTAGSNSIVLAVFPNFGIWTAMANATWLHLSPANQQGAGSTDVVFSYDANPGATRAGTLTIAGQTITVTQAGSTYIQAGWVATLVSSGLNNPSCVAVDGAGNVYIADTGNIAIREWTATDNTVTALVSAGLAYPFGVAVDGAGNVYIADTANNAIKEWTVTNNTLTTLVSSGLDHPYGVAVDGAGNVYIADSGNDAIKEWTVANNTVTTVVSSGLYEPIGVAVDSAGNVYIADTGNNAIEEWTVANNTLTTLVSSGLHEPIGVAVDGAGNVYIADTVNNAIKEWTVANNTVTTLVSAGLTHPFGVTVDGTGNVYIADTYNSAIKELPYAFVDLTPRLEGLAAGHDALPTVLPVTENLLPPFAPTSDQPWLTITGITNGVVSFSFTANTGPARTANITLLGQTIPITQGVIGTPPTLTGLQMPGNGVFQFAFTNTPSAAFTVLSTTNLSLPLSNWTVVGTASNTAPGQFQFTSQPTTNDPLRFYRVRSP
jgi:DNA-binding beta-propeller fold protein YncE